MGRVRGRGRRKNRKLEQMYNRSMENMLFNKKCTYSRGNQFYILEVMKDCSLEIISYLDGQATL